MFQQAASWSYGMCQGPIRPKRRLMHDKATFGIEGGGGGRPTRQHATKQEQYTVYRTGILKFLVTRSAQQLCVS